MPGVGGKRVGWVAVSGASGCSTVLTRRLGKPPPNAVPGLGNRPRKAISTSSLPYPPRALAGEVGVLAAIPLAREKKRDSVVAEPQFKGGRKNPSPRREGLERTSQPSPIGQKNKDPGWKGKTARVSD